MSTPANKQLFKFYSLIFVCLLNLILTGCSSSSPTSKSQQTSISGQVLLPAEAPNNLNLATTSVKIYVEQHPNLTTNPDVKGHFKLNLPLQRDEINIVALLEDTSTNSYFWHHSLPISLSQQPQSVGQLFLEKGVNRVTFTLKDRHQNPIRYAPLLIWGKSQETDFFGRVTSPPMPLSHEQIAITIDSSGFKPVSAIIPFFTEDLGPCIELVQATSQGKYSAPLICFNPVNTQVEPNAQLKITTKIIDPSLAIKPNESPNFACSEGLITPLSDENEILWTAPSQPGLATITASIQAGALSCTTSLGFVVGNSRIVNTRIVSFAPSTAAAGQTVTIKGYGFGEENVNNKIDFGGALGHITSWSDTEIKVTVPRDAETAPLKLIKNQQTITTDNFVVIDYLANIFPTYGAPGAKIKVTGYGFGDLQGANHLELDGDQIQNITKWSNTLIEFLVENLAYSGPLDLVLRNRTRYIDEFTVSRFKKLTPTDTTHYQLDSLPFGRDLSSIIITGEGFGKVQNSDAGSGGVYFRSYNELGQPIYLEGDVIYWSEDEIEVEVPREAKTGDIKLVINDTPLYGPTLTISPPRQYAINDYWSGQILEHVPLISQLALAQDNSLVIADNSNYLLWVYDHNHNLTKTINLSDALTARLPYGIAMDTNENLYVSDMTNSTIVKTTSEGAITTISTHPFGAPKGLCTDTQNRIYIADAQHNQIVILDENLTHLASFGTTGSSLGELNTPMDLCLSPDKKQLYVAEAENHRIQRFAISGTPATPTLTPIDWLGYNGTSFGWHSVGYAVKGSDPNKLDTPAGIACNAQHLYIADTNNGCIKKVNIVTNEILVIGEKGNGNGQYFAPSDVLIGPDCLYIADSENGRVQAVSHNGGFLSIIQPDTSELNISFIDIAINNEKDLIYALDSGACSISIFDYYGYFEQKLGSMGSGKGQLLNPKGIALDSEGNILVVDTGNARVVKFCLNGEIEHFGQYGTAQGQFRSPQKIITDKEDKIYVSDYDNHRVIIFNPDFSYYATLGEGILNQPMGIAIASDSAVYVADSGNHRVCKFDKNQQFLGWLGSIDGVNAGWYTSTTNNAVAGANPCQFDAPAALAIDFEDCLYVIDYKSLNMQKFGPNHKITKGDHISTQRYNINDMILGITIDEAGCLYTVNEDNHIKRLVPLPILN